MLESTHSGIHGSLGKYKSQVIFRFAEGIVKFRCSFEDKFVSCFGFVNMEKEFRIMTYNVYEGAGGRVDQLCDYLRDQKLDVVTLNELNGWDEDILKKNAQSWGHEHSLVLPNQTGFRVGISSRYPFEVLVQNSEDFLHGTIGVRLSNGLAIFALHMNPRTVEDRVKEADKLMELTKPYLDQKTLILGDLNTLSRRDSEHYDRLNIAETFSKHPKLEKKFLTNNQIDYSVIDTFENFFTDLSFLSHTKTSQLEFTVPTDLQEDPMHANTLRLDYAWASPFLVPFVLSCERQVTSMTTSLSDHFPILVRLSL